ncbi:MAG: cation:proton antiporter [Sneathiella sp.]
MRIAGKKIVLSAFLWLLSISPAAASGGELPSLVRDIGTALFVASLLVVIAVRFKIPSIAAFLLAGILIGPVGFKLITEFENIETIAELGFILLLFMIGLEIDIRKLISSGKTIVVPGVLQYPLSVLFGFLVIKGLVWLGLANGLSGQFDALYFGILIAGSSTLLVIKLFQERYELDTESGRISLGMLVFQDIWAIIVIIMQPNFDSPELLPVLVSFLGILMLVGISYGLANTIVAKAFRWLSKEPQTMFVGAIGWCFLIVFIGGGLDDISAYFLGMDTTLSVGSGMCALVAGITIATQPYSREIIGKVGVVRDFFIVLFFVGLGMTIPVITDMSIIWIALALAFFSLLSRQLIFFPLFYFTGGDQRLAQMTSVRLAQLSEFGLVIAYLGTQHGHLSDAFSSAIIIGFIMTALITPTLYQKAYRIHLWISPWFNKIGFKEPPSGVEEGQDHADIVLLGFHRVASSLLHEIIINKPELIPRILVIDFNVQLHPAIRKMGVKVRYGDLANEHTLEHAGIGKAKVVVATIPDDILRGINNEKLVECVRRHNKDAIIISNAEQPFSATDLYKAGADYVYMGRVNTARALDEIISRTLDGSLNEFREEQEEKHGKSHERTEILD